MLEKLKKLGRRGKAILMAACVACTCAVTSVAAFAEETTGTDVVVEETDAMTALMQKASDTLIETFDNLIGLMIPAILGILSGGLVIFGIIALIKLAKKIFGKVAG